MSQEIIYTDQCCKESIEEIKAELDINIVTSLDQEKWNLPDVMSIITLPEISLAVINVIEEVTVLEMALLHFMCKPILITATSISMYPIIEKRIADYVDFNCDLRDKDNNFISWYKLKRAKR